MFVQKIDTAALSTFIQMLNKNQYGSNIFLQCISTRLLYCSPVKALPGSVAFDISNITQPMTVSGMRCDGTESSIVDCTKDRPWVDGGGACTQSEKARVTCEEIDHSPPARKFICEIFTFKLRFYVPVDNISVMTISLYRSHEVA